MHTYYRFIHPDKIIRKRSSSGGAFTLISDFVIENGGVVYGCILTDSLEAKHIRVSETNTRDQMRGSKYIQSNMKDVFPLIKKDLENGMLVLYSGTPCQNYAVLQYLGLYNIDLKNLILLEIICHGVGSAKFFKDYLKNLEVKYSGKACSVNFRAKYHRGQKQDMAVKFDTGKVYHASSTKYDWFYSIYLNNLILRPSCYECPFAKPDRYVDITIADHWGYKDEDVYSLIISNTKKGNKVIGLLNSTNLESITEDEVKQPHLHHPCKRPSKRDKFWNIYNKHGYLAVQTWFGNNTFSGKFKDVGARIAYSFHLAGVIKRIFK